MSVDSTPKNACIRRVTRSGVRTFLAATLLVAVLLGNGVPEVIGSGAGNPDEHRDAVATGQSQAGCPGCNDFSASASGTSSRDGPVDSSGIGGISGTAGRSKTDDAASMLGSSSGKSGSTGSSGDSSKTGGNNDVGSGDSSDFDGIAGTNGTNNTGNGSTNGSSTTGSGANLPPPDRSPPVYLGSSPDPVIFSANNQKSVAFSLHFSDRSPPLSYKNLSVEGVNYRSTFFIHDFSRAGRYDLVYDVCDSVGNCTGNVRLPGFFNVVANVPEWSSTRCLSATCPSKFQLSSGRKIADGVEKHSVIVSLVDRFGNRVITIPGVKKVDTIFNFRNTAKLDQIKGTGDPAVFESSELVVTKKEGITSRIALSDGDGDGVFSVSLKSYTPTSAGYLPIEHLGFDLNFESLDYYVRSIGGFHDVGATAVNANISSSPATRFAFYPTMLALPGALVWNGSSYVTDLGGVKNITVNAIKRFAVYLKNNSDHARAISPQIGIALDSGVDDVTWGRAKIEHIDTIAQLDVDLDLDTDGDRYFDHVVTNLSDWIGSVTEQALKALRFRAIPELESGKSIEGSVPANLQTYVCYTVGGKNVCHRGEKLEKESERSEQDQLTGSALINERLLDESGEAANLYNPGIDILGSIRSVSGAISKQTGVAINQSLGDVVKNEFQDTINRNLASLLENPNEACKSDAIITSADLFDDLGCKLHNGSATYFRNADLTLNLTDETLPDGLNTIVVEGGDLWIRSNLKYPVGTHSFGIIVLKDRNGDGGNIFIYPEVTNLVGAVYAEGGVISVNAQGTFGEDESPDCDGRHGFCDRSYELRDQLHWKGLLATANTIGGSDKNPIECPEGVVCDSRETARVYDLGYLRTFHPDSGGQRAADAYGNGSFVVEYDSRIQSHTPPLFEFAMNSANNDLGADLMDVIKRATWPF